MQPNSGTTTLSGIKSYSGTTATFFKSLDSASSCSRDASSPVVLVAQVPVAPEPKKKPPLQRRTAAAAKPRESQAAARRNKRTLDGGLLHGGSSDGGPTAPKQLRLSLMGGTESSGLSQDDASNSNSSLVSRLSSPARSGNETTDARELGQSQKVGLLCKLQNLVNYSFRTFFISVWLFCFVCLFI